MGDISLEKNQKINKRKSAEINNQRKRQQRMFKVSADPYGAKGGDEDDVMNVTNGENSVSS